MSEVFIGNIGAGEILVLGGMCFGVPLAAIIVGIISTYNNKHRR